MLRSQFLKLPEKGGRLLDEIKNTHPTLQADGLRPAVAHGGNVTKRVGEAGGKQEKGAQTTELCSPSGDQVDAVTETRGSSRERSPGLEGPAVRLGQSPGNRQRQEAGRGEDVGLPSPAAQWDGGRGRGRRRLKGPRP